MSYAWPPPRQAGSQPDQGDGYWILVIRDGKRVRLLSRNGTDWSKRYHWIVQAAL